MKFVVIRLRKLFKLKDKHINLSPRLYESQSGRYDAKIFFNWLGCNDLQLVDIGMRDGNTSMLTLRKLIYVYHFRNVFINFARRT